MFRDVVACGSLRDHGWFLEDVSMHILFGCEFFVAVESTRHLEDVLPSMVLCFCSFVEDKSAEVRNAGVVRKVGVLVKG